MLEVVPGTRSVRPAKLSLEAISLTLPTGQRLAVLTAPVTKLGQVRSGQAFPDGTGDLFPAGRRHLAFNGGHCRQRHGKQAIGHQ